MIRLILLDIILLAAIGISVCFPYPSHEMTMASDDGVLSQSEDENAVVSNDDSPYPSEDERAIATYGDGKIATNDGELMADISQAGECGCDLRAYDRKNYYGRSLLIRQQNANFKNDYYNDRMESVKISGRCQWLLYEHINFLGQAFILSPGNYPSPYRWKGRDNHISSARALPAQGQRAIVLFQHSNYKGRMLVLYGSNTNLPAIDFNDQLSSFIITGGCWTLYEHTYYRGKRATYRPGKYSTSSLGRAGGNDKISSVMLRTDE